MTQFRDSYLSGASECLNSAGELKGSFDVFLTASSWDRRCVSIIGAEDVTADVAVPMFFDVRDSSGLRDEHDKKITEYCERMANRTIPINGSSRDVQALWSKIQTTVVGIASERQRPLHLLFDISTCPRYYFMATCAAGLLSGLIDTITVFYAEALYPDKASEVAFTGGRWRTVPIPGLLGDYKPESKRFYFVSVGFEGWKTLRIVARADPDRVSILLPDPGVTAGYAKEAYDNNFELIDSYRIPDDQIVKAHAADAIAAWKALSDRALEREHDENTYFLCCGTKPHALAFALRAMSLGFPTVLYNVPDEHKVHVTESNGRFWKYVIEDVTALPRG